MKKMLSLMLAISCILLTCIGCGGMETGDAAGEGATSGETVVWKMATQDTADSANGLGCEKFAELIAEKDRRALSDRGPCQRHPDDASRQHSGYPDGHH